MRHSLDDLSSTLAQSIPNRAHATQFTRDDLTLGPPLAAPQGTFLSSGQSPWGMAQGRLPSPGKCPMPSLKLHRNEEDKAVCSPQETSLPKDLPKFQEDYRIRRFHMI
jgi:hypothetical protein